MTRTVGLGSLHPPARTHGPRRSAGSKGAALTLPDLGPDAACLDPSVDPEWFFPPGTANGRSTAAVELEARAKAVCHTCPAITECLESALERNAKGVWGGLGEGERKRLRARRRAS